MLLSEKEIKNSLYDCWKTNKTIKKRSQVLLLEHLRSSYGFIPFDIAKCNGSIILGVGKWNDYATILKFLEE